ncbi:hypothetical protein CFC21_045597, partial [Triticum aestivum]
VVWNPWTTSWSSSSRACTAGSTRTCTGVGQAGADALHLLALPHRPGLHHRSLLRDQAPRPVRQHHDGRRRLLPGRRCERGHAHRSSLASASASVTRIRDAVNQLTACLGILAANMINYFTDCIHPWGWRLSPWAPPPPPSSARCTSRRRPILVQHGLLEEARRVLEKLRGTHKVDAGFEDLKEEGEAARHVPEPVGRAEPAAAHHRRAEHPKVPAAIWHELHHVLLSGHL